ncbi:Gfo/Idh/MocA family oxidoreductase [Microbacterium sp. zg.Y625]|uniref:Gfo/Idh/MocA family protein n=1 Tax=Microbacterium jiangjiandongii TaxID=3049071 RepID=UPI00214C707C|nr:MULTISPECIES: Gfo/Idh/MocA family oxidoreductase [unclassified Microbacterium]MCR2792750.1 Gfo/Idh/MocA family oxidoreductase [Microbacterium sp. zg.Y625]WIM26728.1 Gfo/Idh/MocA family oxidoreductase [Microbacterium sp. zg-Y625]
MTKWAVVGTGAVSRSVVPDMQELADVVLVHSRDRGNAERFASEFGIPRSTADYEVVLQDTEVDAVYIATPFALHFEMTKRALQAGKHVLVEKPMALNTAEVEGLFEIARAQDVFLMEAMWMKFSPVYTALHEQLRDRVIGDVRNLRASFGIPFPDPTGSRTDLSRSGGALLDQGIYPVTLAQSVLGEPTGIIASGAVRDDGLDFSAHFTLEFSGGRYAQCACSMVEFTELTASVAGTEGWLTLSPPFWATTDLEIHAGDLRRVFREPGLITHPREGSGYVPMVRAVMDALKQGLREHPLHTGADTAAVFRTMDGILAQIRSTHAPSEADALPH